MVIWHISPLVDAYMRYIDIIRPKLKFNPIIYKYVSIILLLISLGFAIADAIFIAQDKLLLRGKKTELLTWIGLIIFFDIMKLYYIIKRTFLFTVIMAIASIVFISIIINYVHNIKNQEGRDIKSLAEYSLVFLIASLVFSTIFHWPTFGYILNG